MSNIYFFQIPLNWRMVIFGYCTFCKLQARGGVPVFLLSIPTSSLWFYNVGQHSLHFQNLCSNSVSHASSFSHPGLFSLLPCYPGIWLSQLSCQVQFLSLSWTVFNIFIDDLFNTFIDWCQELEIWVWMFILSFSVTLDMLSAFSFSLCKIEKTSF